MSDPGLCPRRECDHKVLVSLMSSLLERVQALEEKAPEAEWPKNSTNGITLPASTVEAVREALGLAWLGWGHCISCPECGEGPCCSVCGSYDALNKINAALALLPTSTPERADK